MVRIRAAPATILAAGGAIVLLLGALAWGAPRFPDEAADAPSFVSIARVLVDESPETRFLFPPASYRVVPFGGFALDAANGTLRLPPAIDRANVTGAFLVVRPYEQALGGHPQELALAVDQGGPFSMWVNATPSEAIDQNVQVDAARAHVHFWRLHGCEARFFDSPETTRDVAPHLYLTPEFPTGTVEFLGGESDRGACPRARLEFAWIGPWRLA